MLTSKNTETFILMDNGWAGLGGGGVGWCEVEWNGT
jgi:hypothetical protein